MPIYLGNNNITGGFTAEEKKQFNNSINLINEQLDDKVNKTDIIDKTDIVDTLTSTDTDKPLSANQGKVLKTELDKTNAKLGEKADKSYVDDKANETISNPTELDTDKYIKNGFYSIGDATKRTNLPIQKVGTLLVYYAGHYVIQEYILNENLRRFMRRSTDKGTNWSTWQELATMDKIALKHESFNQKVTLTDSNWKYETITFGKNYKNTPSINVSCGDYLNTKFYEYWGCEAHIININNKGCTIRYRSSKASESESIEVNIIVFVNGI